MNVLVKKNEPSKGTFVRKIALWTTLGLCILGGCTRQVERPPEFVSGKFTVYKNGKVIARGHGEGRNEGVLGADAADMLKITGADSVTVSFKTGNSEMKLTYAKE